MRKFRTTGLLLAFVAVAAPAQAERWDCRNDQFEITCGKGKCETSDGFTPMSVSLDDASGMMDVCAYSGCWQGTGKVVKAGEFVTFLGIDLSWNGLQPSPASFVVTIDGTDRIAVLKGGGFAHPMSCQTMAPSGR